MKRLLTLCAGALLLVVTGCDTADTMGPEDGGSFDARPTYTGDGYCGDTDPASGAGGYDYCVDLIAGQTQKVGQVYYGYDGTTFSIRYVLTEPGLCLDEVHFGAYDSIGQMPTVGNGNLPPGQLAMSDDFDGCTTNAEYSYGVNLTGDYFVAAHAVVVGSDGSGGEECGYIFGIAKDGDIYKISLDETSVTGSSHFFDTQIGTPWNTNWPNGLALDALNERLYFTNTVERDGPHPLYFLDLSGAPSQQNSGGLTWRNASATFFGGNYYYIPQNEGDNLYETTFNADGTVASDELLCGNFMGGSNTPLFFGDIAYRDGVIYGSGSEETDGTPSAFFALDPETCQYTELTSHEDHLLQLAFDCDGRLIGHDTSSREFFQVDPSTGDLTSLGFLPSTIQFNDLASGACECAPPVEFDETAWGFGQQTFAQAFKRRGNGGQWGWVFKGDAGN